LELSFYRVCWFCHFTGCVGTVILPGVLELSLFPYFGPKTLRHQDISALVSGHLGTSAWILRHCMAERRWDSAQACIGKRPL